MERMDQGLIFAIILGMMAVTYLPRMLPALFLSSRTLSPVIVRFLSYVPAAVLAAMLFPSLFVREGRLDVSPDNLFLWAAVPAFLLALKTKSLFGAVALGMGLVAAGRYFLGG